MHLVQVQLVRRFLGKCEIIPILNLKTYVTSRPKNCVHLFIFFSNLKVVGHVNKELNQLVHYLGYELPFNNVFDGGPHCTVLLTQRPRDCQDFFSTALLVDSREIEPI